MKKEFLSLALLGALAVASTASARDMAITGDVGTTGAGLHLVTPLMNSVNARIGFNAFSDSRTEETDGATYNAKAKLRTFDALLDYYPSSTQFRMTAGLVYNGTKVTANARPKAGNSYEFNGRLYDATDVGEIDAKIDFNKVAPYLGIGWGNAVAKGWGFTTDIGVLFQGKPKVNLENRGCDPTLPGDTCTTLASDLEAEEDELRDDVKDFRYYPVIRIGLTYKF